MKTIESTCIKVNMREKEMAVFVEVLKVATSDGPLGTVAGVQFAAVFQSPLAGLRFHVALPAEATCAKSKESRPNRRRDR